MIKKYFEGEYKRITVTTIVMALLTCGAGVLLHFMFGWTGNNVFVGLFSSVNESTWEHLKLLFIPYAIFGIFEYAIYGKDIRNFFSAKFFGVVVGLLNIAMSYYFYTGAFGINNSAINIGIFFASVLIAYFCAWRRMIKPVRIGGGLWESLAILLFGAMCALFFIFTLYPPEIPIFMDPVTKIYGIPR